MNNTIKIEVTNKDYRKIMDTIVDIYGQAGAHVFSKGDRVELTFTCKPLTFKRCKHDIDLAIKLGIEVKAI